MLNRYETTCLAGRRANVMKIYEKNLLFFLILILVDQLSKYIIRVKGGFYICNQGIAFGIRLPIFLIYTSIILLLLYLFLNYRRQSGFFVEKLSVILLLSGALSNFIDRLYWGCVIDFIDLKFWPIFNFADIYITIGSALLIYQLIKQKA